MIESTSNTFTRSCGDDAYDDREQDEAEDVVGHRCADARRATRCG